MGKRITALVLALALVSVGGAEAKDDDYIHYVEFNASYNAMSQALQYDLDTYGEPVHLDWVELLAVLASRYGGDFSKYRARDLDELAEALISGENLDDITSDL